MKYDDGTRFDVMREWFWDVDWMRPLMEEIGIALKRAEEAGWRRK